MHEHGRGEAARGKASARGGRCAFEPSGRAKRDGLLAAVLPPLAAAFSLLLVACGGGGSGGSSSGGGGSQIDLPNAPGDDTPGGGTAGYVTAPGVERCSVDDIKAKVDFDMRDYYIYADQVPQLRLDDFATPEALIEALRVDPDVYSSVTDAAEASRLREEGIDEGYGFWFLPNADGAVRFREIRAGSPADTAGLRRGDEVLALDGVDIGAYGDAELQTALAADRLVLAVRSGAQPPREVALERGGYRWITVPDVEFPVFESPSSGLEIGYLPVQRFLETTEAELDEQVRELLAIGIDELVLDLRYNDGGDLRVSQRLAAQIGGDEVVGEVYQRGRANDRYREELGFESVFRGEGDSFDLARVIVLATDFTASAAEAVINGLEPYMEVVVIGGRSEGKPFTSTPEEYCDRSINAMSLLLANARGVDVFGGIAPDCAVEDTWSVPADDPDDALLGAALAYAESGACPATPAADAVSARTGELRGSASRATSAARLAPLE